VDEDLFPALNDESNPVMKNRKVSGFIFAHDFDKVICRLRSEASFIYMPYCDVDCIVCESTEVERAIKVEPSLSWQER